MRAVLSIIFLIFAIFSAHQARAQSAYQKAFTFGDGSDAFVLRQAVTNQLGYDAVLQFNGSDELWTMTKSQGARGDIVYKNDTGRVFLRVNHIGGATLYPTPDSMGVPVLRQSEFRFETANPQLVDIENDELGSVEEWGRVYEYAGNKNENTKSEKRSQQRNIEFPNWPQSNLTYQNEIIDHLSVFLENHPEKGIEKVIVKIADQPAAAHDESKLMIWVNPSMGYAGRPSTEKMLLNLNDKNG